MPKRRVCAPRGGTHLPKQRVCAPAHLRETRVWALRGGAHVPKKRVCPGCLGTRIKKSGIRKVRKHPGRFLQEGGALKKQKQN